MSAPDDKTTTKDTKPAKPAKGFHDGDLVTVETANGTSDYTFHSFEPYGLLLTQLDGPAQFLPYAQVLSVKALPPKES